MGIHKDFFEAEVRCGHKISKDTKKVWSYQLDLLEKFSEVCHRHKLRFWLDSGTLLGAVRHKGYIPWDDDIDVIMFREDYDKLLNIASIEFHNPYIFQTAYTEKHFVRGHAQLRNSNTSAILPDEIYKNFNQGIFIDIFVMDNVPEDEDLNDKICSATRLRQRLELLAQPWRIIINTKQPILHTLRYKLKHPTRRAFVKMYKAYEDLFRNIPENSKGLVACLAWDYNCRTRKKQYYDETIYVDFEFLKMPIPKEYDNLLSDLYGDYMKPVKSPNCHGEVIFDAYTPANRLIKQLRKS